MRALGLVALLVYTFGAFAYGAILFLWITLVRSRRWSARNGLCPPAGREAAAVNGVLLVVSLLWFCCNVGLVLYRLVPLNTPWQLDVASVFLAFAFPPIIMHTTLTEVADADPSRVSGAWRAVIWPVYAAALVIPVWGVTLLIPSTVDPAARQLGNQLLGFGLTGGFVAAAVYSIALIATHGDAREPRRERGRQWTLGLFGLMAVLFLLILGLTVLSSNARPWQAAFTLLEIAAKSLPLVFLFVGTYHDNPFEFFDLFVKRGAAIVVVGRGPDRMVRRRLSGAGALPDDVGGSVDSRDRAAPGGRRAAVDSRPHPRRPRSPLARTPLLDHRGGQALSRHVAIRDHRGAPHRSGAGRPRGDLRRESHRAPRGERPGRARRTRKSWSGPAIASSAVFSWGPGRARRRTSARTSRC